MRFCYLFVFLIISCNQLKNSKEGGVVVEDQFQDDLVDQSFKVVNFEGLTPFLTESTSKVTVINFWATWCKPCVQELPYFERIKKEYKSQDVKMILVSLDFPDQKEGLEMFIEKRALMSEIILLDDANANSWIPKVDQNWSGAIPATIIYNQSKRSFYERSFTYEELEKEIKQFL